eukprot:CFRG0888T1
MEDSEVALKTEEDKTFKHTVVMIVGLAHILHACTAAVKCRVHHAQQKEEGGNVKWDYSMRREMQEIVLGVFLGPYSCALRQNALTLRNAGVTHIVCIRHMKEAQVIRCNSPEMFQYLVLTIADVPEENIIQHFPVFREFIDSALDVGGKVLVHGNASISRSAALMIAYTMERYNCSFESSFKLVQSYRFCIHPSEAFCHQLKEYEYIYRARVGSSEQQRSSRKRVNKEEPERREATQSQAMLM